MRAQSGSESQLGTARLVIMLHPLDVPFPEGPGKVLLSSLGLSRWQWRRGLSQRAVSMALMSEMPARDIHDVLGEGSWAAYAR